MSRPPINLTLRDAQAFRDYSTGFTSTVSVPSFTSQESSSGTSRRKPSTGWIPPTNYTYSLNTLQPSRGIFENFRRISPTLVIGYKYEGTVLTTDSTGPYSLETCCNQALSSSGLSISQAMEDAALNQALSNLKGMRVDLGTAFGERKATAKMLGNTATNIARAVKALRRGNVRDAMRSLGMATDRGMPRGSNWTNNWLALQYGWKPLLSDCYGAVQALSKLPGDRWRVTAKGFKSESSFPSFQVTPGGSSPTGYRSQATLKRLAFCRIDALSSNDLVQSFSSLGVLNPLNVAWELVPYSFVVDWFLPIGDWLSNLDAYLGYSNITVCRTRFAKADWKVTGLSGFLSNGARITNDFEGSKKRIDLFRYVTGQVAPPFPRFKDPRSLGHLANGLSLLAQAFR